MSVIEGPNQYPAGSEQWEAAQVFIYDPLAFEGSCFYCGREMAWPVVHWHGYTGDVFLHPDCAGLLSMHLASDTLKAQKMRAIR
jgi:hypothetical protein